MKSNGAVIKTTAITLLAVFMGAASFIFIKGWMHGHFNSVNTLRIYIGSYGICAPIILILIQFLLTILPIFPSFAGYIVGAALYGADGGFWTNYIGISVGSIAAYALGKHFGIQLVNRMLPMQKYETYIEKINLSKSYPKLLFIAILLPMAPDNFLCYFSGLVNMPARKFVTIIITAKPWCILFYSIFFAYFI